MQNPENFPEHKPGVEDNDLFINHRRRIADLLIKIGDFLDDAEEDVLDREEYDVQRYGSLGKFEVEERF
jgi:hypothetical protein